MRSKKLAVTTERFKEEGKIAHGDRYDYSLITECNKNNIKVPIVCKEHGVFYQDFNHHINRKHGCPYCAGNFKKTKDDIINDAISVWGSEYDYSKSSPKSTHDKMIITCRKHGDFEMTPHDHIHGRRGCRKCANERLSNENSLDVQEVKNRIIKVHGHKFIIPDDFKYINKNVKVKLICHEHGEFWQYPYALWNGVGCPKCNKSHMENEIETILECNNIQHEYQKHFDWLGKMSLDFYLPEHNIAIECQGKQHFEAVDFFGGEKGFIEQSKRDIKKKNLCLEHGITMLYYSNVYNIDGIISNVDDLLLEIKKS